jgi:hypothetical protein
VNSPKFEFEVKVEVDVSELERLFAIHATTQGHGCNHISNSRQQGSSQELSLLRVLTRDEINMTALINNLSANESNVKL